jgi:prepilin-type N-terminal cleavage/methylation domain-containing protein
MNPALSVVRNRLERSIQAPGVGVLRGKVLQAMRPAAPPADSAKALPSRNACATCRARVTGAKKKSAKAFTLAEIMIVVAIIGVLLAIAIPSFVKARTETLRNLCIENMRVILHASCIYETESGTLLTGGTNGVFLRNTLMNGGYIRKRDTFECPVSHVVDYDDYALVYSGEKLIGIRCTLLPGDHVLP